ncbi:MAG: ceramidase domain-containing protein [Chitinophagaceae bacterium]
MKRQTRILLLVVVTLAAIAIVVILPPIPQSLAYHLFADRRAMAGIPNFANVFSNIPFLLVGGYGLYLLGHSNAANAIKLIYGIIFSGIVFTGLGSAYYHYAPGNYSLVFDRLPMVIVFMAFLCATIADWINVKAGTILLMPLLLLGLASVIYWYYTELKGTGDLRFYGFIQYYPMLIIPFIFLLFASPAGNKGLYLLIWVMAWYGIAKVCEATDAPVYHATGFISGHSLKHITAAIATWYLVRFFKKKYCEGALMD